MFTGVGMQVNITASVQLARWLCAPSAAGFDGPESCIVRMNAGVVSNISQCQIALSCAIARGRSRSLVRHCLFDIYFFGYGYV